VQVFELYLEGFFKSLTIYMNLRQAQSETVKVACFEYPVLPFSQEYFRLFGESQLATQTSGLLGNIFAARPGLVQRAERSL